MPTLPDPPRRLTADLRQGTLRTVRALADRVLERFGLRIGSRAQIDRSHRLTYGAALDHAKRMGLDPRTVIDVGVATGTWQLYEAFAHSRILLIEPVEETAPHLRAIAARFPSVEFVVAAASRHSGRITLNVHRDVERTSVHWESDYRAGDVERREVPSVTLDQLRRERQLAGPILLKIDVQGAELDVLEGGAKTLGDTEYVILETCLFEFFDGGPLVSEVVGYMKARGFALYDVLSIHYRPLDGAVSTLDLAFVKESGRLRRVHRYQKEPS